MFSRRAGYDGLIRSDGSVYSLLLACSRRHFTVPPTVKKRTLDLKQALKTWNKNACIVRSSKARTLWFHGSTATMRTNFIVVCTPGKKGQERKNISTGDILLCSPIFWGWIVTNRENYCFTADNSWMQTIFGFMNYVERFVPKFVRPAEPFHAQCSKKAP